MASETGEPWSMAEAERVLFWAIEELLSKFELDRVEKIILPIGNDLLHTDNLAGTTTRGTPQHWEMLWVPAFKRVWRLIVQVIERLLQVAPVEVFMVPGNHDYQTTSAIGEILEAWFRETDAVTVDNRECPRKYMRYGASLLGFTHGHLVKALELPLIMAQEAPELWSSAYFREVHIGHTHAKKETVFHPVREKTGVRVRVLPSLCATDSWHASKGYRHMRSAEALLWDHDTGYDGHRCANVITDDDGVQLVA